MSAMGLDHRGVLTGGPHDGMVLDVPRETGDTIRFPVRDADRIIDMAENVRSYTEYDEYRISHPPRLNSSGTAVVYEYVGRV